MIRFAAHVNRTKIHFRRCAAAVGCGGGGGTSFEIHQVEIESDAISPTVFPLGASM